MTADPRRKNKIVMCVDDDPTIREIVVDCLRAAGYQVIACKTGEECLTRLVRMEVQIILLDLEMPDMDGFSTLQELRRRFPKLTSKIVVLTASKGSHDVQQARDLGAHDYLVKPFQVDRLIQRVDRLAGLRASLG